MISLKFSSRIHSTLRSSCKDARRGIYQRSGGGKGAKLPIIIRLFIGKELWSIRSSVPYRARRVVGEWGKPPPLRGADQSRASKIDPTRPTQQITIDFHRYRPRFHRFSTYSSDLKCSINTAVTAECDQSGIDVSSPQTCP